MKKLIRKVTYKLYPNKIQSEHLDSLFIHHHQLYNWALSDRIKTYQHFHYGLSYHDQSAINTFWRQTRKTHHQFNANAQSEQITLKRVDSAFKQFFRKLKEGHKKAGFPRFKSYERFSGFGYASHGDGWKLLLNKKKHGALRLTNVGIVKIRGKARNEDGIPKTCEVLKKGDDWFVSVSFEYKTIKRNSGKSATTFDWGVSHFINIVNSDGEYQQIENPRFFQQAKDKLKTLQQDFAQVKKGTRQHVFLKKQIAKWHRHIAAQRLDFTHKTTSKLVAVSGLIGAEKLNVKNMTASSKGTIEKPGKKVRQKSGLNREILNTMPAATYKMLQYKAEEADIELSIAPTKSLKPSQRCPACDTIKKKALSERTHQCTCGTEMPRDIASALVVMNWLVGFKFDVRNLRPGSILKETHSKLTA